MDVPGYDNWKTHDPSDGETSDVKAEVTMHLPEELDKDQVIEQMEQKNFTCGEMNLTDEGWSITFSQEIEYGGSADDFNHYLRDDIIGQDLYDQMDEVEIDTSGLDYGPDPDDARDHYLDL